MALEGILDSQERAQSSILDALYARTLDEFGNPCDRKYWNCMWHHRQHCPQDRMLKCAGANTVVSDRKKAKYTIHILEMKMENWIKDGYTVDVHLSKEYGSCQGSYGGAKTLEEAVKRARTVISQWEEYDGIVSRMGDKVTLKNTDFVSDFDDITLQDILKGQKRVMDFFGP